MKKYRAQDLIALAYTPTDDDGAALVVAGPATATVFDGAGTQIETGPAEVDAAGLHYSLAGSALKLDTYSVVWTGSAGGVERTWRDSFELVGAFIIAPADIRHFNSAFADATKFPTADLEQCRDEIEEILEQNGMCAFRPRGVRLVLSGRGRTNRLVLPITDIQEVYSVSVYGVALDVTKLSYLGNAIERTDYEEWPRGFANIAVHCAYGYVNVPAAIRKAALILAKERVVPASQISARATATTIGDQTYRITIAGRDGFTGIPDVDSAVDQFGRRRPVAG